MLISDSDARWGMCGCGDGIVATTTATALCLATSLAGDDDDGGMCMCVCVVCCVRSESTKQTDELYICSSEIGRIIGDTWR